MGYQIAVARFEAKLPTVQEVAAACTSISGLRVIAWERELPFRVFEDESIIKREVAFEFLSNERINVGIHLAIALVAWLTHRMSS